MAKSGTWIKKSYWCLVQGEKFLGNILLLIIRLYWGCHFMMTGFGKWMHIHKVEAFFNSLDIPAPLFNAYFVGTVEFLGGLCLILGLFTRVVTIPLAIVLITAYATAESGTLASLFTDQKAFFAADPFLFLYATLVLLCFGAGAISFDRWIEKKTFGAPL